MSVEFLIYFERGIDCFDYVTRANFELPRKNFSLENIQNESSSFLAKVKLTCKRKKKIGWVLKRKIVWLIKSENIVYQVLK